VLTDFVEQRMREGDLVSQFSLGQHQGIEQFSNNRELLKSLAAGHRTTPRTRLGLVRSSDDEDAVKLDENYEVEEINRLQDLSLTGLESIVESMKGMPGRKSVVFFSFGTGNPQTLSNMNP
jgi:hypothetical protein